MKLFNRISSRMDCTLDPMDKHNIMDTYPTILSSRLVTLDDDLENSFNRVYRLLKDEIVKFEKENNVKLNIKINKLNRYIKSLDGDQYFLAIHSTLHYSKDGMGFVPGDIEYMGDDYASSEDTYPTIMLFNGFIGDCGSHVGYRDESGTEVTFHYLNLVTNLGLDAIITRFRESEDVTLRFLYGIIEPCQELLNEINAEYYAKIDALRKSKNIYCKSIGISNSNKNKYDIFNFKIDSKILDEFNPNYYQDVDTLLLSQEFKQSTSGLLILTGEPGTGKSKLSSYITNSLVRDYIEDGDDEKFTVIILDQNLIKDPEYCSYFSGVISDTIADNADLETIVVLLEDINPNILKRDEKNFILENLLGILDGLSKFDLKVIMTTNQESPQIDSALGRYGRLFDIINIAPLDKDYAIELAKSEGNDISDHPYFKDNDTITASYLRGILSSKPDEKEPKCYMKANSRKK